MSRQVLLYTSCLLLGCAAPQRPSTGQPAGHAGELGLAMQVVSGEAPNWNPVSPGSVLHNGEFLRVEVQVNRSAHVYVVQAPPDSPPEVLLDDISLGAKKALRIPEDDKGFRLNGATGQEELFVVASERPLCEVDQALCAKLHVPCKAAIGSGAGETAQGAVVTRGDLPPPPPPPPPTINIRNRGDFFVERGIPQVQLAWADAHGVAMVRFTYRHER